MGMTTRLCCACPCPSFMCNNQPSGQNRKLGSHCTERFHGSAWSLFVLGRPVRELAARCSTNSVERLDAERPVNVDECSWLQVREEGSREEDVKQVRLEDLRIGGLHKGKVSVVESYGVFVDIGTHVDGFVHISRLHRSLVRKEEDVVQVGQDVTVQIVDLDPRADYISLLLAPEEDFTKPLKLQPLTLSEREILNRAAGRRAKKIALRCAETLSTRRVMSLETRRRLKAHRRSVLAERQAIQLHQARSRTSFCKTPEGVDDPG